MLENIWFFHKKSKLQACGHIERTTIPRVHFRKDQKADQTSSIWKWIQFQILGRIWRRWYDVFYSSEHISSSFVVKLVVKYFSTLCIPILNVSWYWVFPLYTTFFFYSTAQSKYCTFYRSTFVWQLSLLYRWQVSIPPFTVSPRGDGEADHSLKGFLALMQNLVETFCFCQLGFRFPSVSILICCTILLDYCTIMKDGDLVLFILFYMPLFSFFFNYFWPGCFNI